MAETKVKFGFGQIFKATPDDVKKTLTISTIILAFLVTGVSASSYIPPMAAKEINIWLGAALVALHSLGSLFGVEIKDSSVPADKVTAVKE